VVVVNIAEPAANVAVPRAVVELLLKKFTCPVAAEGVTVAVRVTVCPKTAAVGAAAIVVVVAVLPRLDHATARLFRSTEPKPVTRL
jgi:hypothetical protein